MAASPHARTTIVSAAADVLVSEFGDELVLLNLRNGVYYGLEGVGARVWALVQEPISVSELCDAIVGEHDVERPRCDADVEALLRDLAAQGLITCREDV
jgi:hypothetical protein